MRPVAMLARLDLLVSNPLNLRDYILRYATLLFFTKDFNDQQGQFHPKRRVPEKYRKNFLGRGRVIYKSSNFALSKIADIFNTP